MTVKEIGETIRVMRLSRGMTQSELAKAAGLKQSTIAMYEAGNRRPNEEAAEALADAFNVPKWAIYYREDEMEPKSSEDESDHQTPKWKKLSEGTRTLSDEQIDRLYNVAHAMYPDNFPAEE